MNLPFLCGCHSIPLPEMFFMTEGLYQQISAASVTKADTKIARITIHLQSAQVFRGRVEKCKRGTSSMYRVNCFALRGDTRVALELNTGTFWMTRRALGQIGGALGPSVSETLGALWCPSTVTLVTCAKNVKTEMSQ